MRTYIADEAGLFVMEETLTMTSALFTHDGSNHAHIILFRITRCS